MSTDAIAIRVSDSAISDTRFKIRTGVALILAVTIGTMIFFRWLFEQYIDPDFWRFVLLAAIPTYLILHLLSLILARKPHFQQIEFSVEGLHLPPMTEKPIPWSQIDSIHINTDGQHGTGQYVQVDIKRDYYKTIKSATFDFAKDERKRLFTCNIAFHLGVLDQSQVTFENLVDQFAPTLKKIMTSG